MTRLTRRHFTAGAALALATGSARAAADPIELEWDDLIPEDGRASFFDQMTEDFGITQQGELSSPFEPQDRKVPMETKYNGKRVRLPGYMVPIAYEGTGVTQLLLVPYVGACIHVPPPPPNQIVMVTAKEPYEVTGYFEAVFVTGHITTMAVETDLAEIGYVMTDAEIEPYE